eukprot:TRINITY_DN58195_c0_g1_i1.p1 TRINITY_DN58195_c0_g1~~TRINITY_DN58195_c0_g1_i1.p1  ORF type:complete len:801 (+),score=113.51 TRINITY_DN58195_c0_g1_i1:74-2476(+)
MVSAKSSDDHYAASWLCVAMLTSLPSSASGAESIILDDQVHRAGASNFWPSAGIGSSAWIDSCFKDAHGEGFHHDGLQAHAYHAMGRPQGSFTFEFEPPMTGCYRIEEHHLIAENYSCLKYMAQSVQLMVNPRCSDCGLKTFAMYIDQREELEVRWNALGQLTFYAGYRYSLSLLNSESMTCDAKRLYNTADAATSDTCSWANTTANDDQLECKDGTLCFGESCCSGRGGRARCPPNFPIMCNARICGEHDYCCESSCDRFGGARQCPKAVCATLTNIVGKCYSPANLPDPGSLSYFASGSHTSVYNFWDATWAYVAPDRAKGGGVSCGHTGSHGGFIATTTKPMVMVIGCSSLIADNTPATPPGSLSLDWTPIAATAWTHGGIKLFRTLLPVGRHIVCCANSWSTGAWIKEDAELKTDQCLVLADALRLTHISSDFCPFQEYDRAMRHDLNLVQARRDASDNLVWTNGRIRLNLESGGSSSALEEMQGRLWQHKAMVETTLKDMVRAEQVKVEGVKLGHSTLEVSFLVIGHQTTQISTNDFARKLSDALRNAGSNLKVTAVEVAWQDEELPPEQMGSHAGVVAGISCAGICFCACAAYFVWRFECRKETNATHHDSYSPDAPNAGVVPPNRNIDLESAGQDSRPPQEAQPRAIAEQRWISQDELRGIRPSAEEHSLSPAERWARERGNKLMIELRTLEQLPEEQRRAGLRALQRELHPDKLDPELQGPQAQSLFEIVQAKWERLENERRSRVDSEDSCTVAAVSRENSSASQYGKTHAQPDLSNLRPSRSDNGIPEYVD